MSETKRPWKWLRIGLEILVWAYLAFLFSWALQRALFGDRWWWLFLLNSFSLYLFLPLPLAGGIAFYLRRRGVWAGLAVGLGVYVALYGELFLPRLIVPVRNDPALTVMTYNIHGINHDSQAVAEVIRTTDADVIAFQELNHTIAETLTSDFHSVYPYQILDADDKWSGAGMISRYPLREVEKKLGSRWHEAPQALSLDFDGQEVTLVHFHTAATTDYRNVAHIRQTVQAREEQTQAIVDFVETRPGPLVATTDFNATNQGTAYQMMTEVLSDSWRKAGRGFGHTYPGWVPYVGSSFPRWLLRIDYVFHSDHWQAESAEVGPWDGVSDHRPVVVTLRLRDASSQKVQQ